MKTKEVLNVWRDGTDDTEWVIPEIIHQDMYRMEKLVAMTRGIGGCCIDLGAHIGAFSCMLAACGFDRKIMAFEPHPDNFELLKQNAERWPRIRPFNEAVTVDGGAVDLFDRGGTGRWSTAPESDGKPREAIVASSRSFRKILAGDPGAAILKIDLEGAEAEILNTASSTQLEKIGVIVLEEHHHFVDHSRFVEIGFRLWLQPYDSKRHKVYVHQRLNPGD
jgi:FkbM family methyltransferase